MKSILTDRRIFFKRTIEAEGLGRWGKRRRRPGIRRRRVGEWELRRRRMSKGGGELVKEEENE
ncbi:MAG: hypothetical protein LBR53_02715 [Deltaproteobacteria bacterium]|jgi:hypothetical protein|nr:hypothetical protein [Deltaproteobacteria bacterium]